MSRTAGRLLSAALAAAAFFCPVAAQTDADRLLRDSLRPLYDWRDLARGPERVVFLGQFQGHALLYRGAAARMEDLKREGITHIGLELPKDLQKSIERFQEDPQAAGVLKTFIEKMGESMPDEAEALRALVNKAKGSGMGVLALDSNENLGPGVGGPGPMDQRMAGNLGGFLKDHPGARVLVLLGALRADKEAQPEALAKSGWPSRSYRFLSGSRALAPRDADILDALRRLGLQESAHLIPCPCAYLRGPCKFDGLLAFPRPRR